ncbi:MAG: cytochrome c biogenesis protein CcsA [Thermoplasmata archaeon]|nr:cytochrome c biogenesis protein CcsA [Thermoplasmata archaeon]
MKKTDYLKMIFVLIAAVLTMTGLYMAFVWAPPHGTHIFDLDQEHKDVYLAEPISDELIEAFNSSEEHINLSYNATIKQSLNQNGRLWLIKDGDSTFWIMDSDTELKVFAENMGDVQRIFYFHVASAWVAYLAFIITFIGSLAYLKTNKMKYDILAFSSAEIGIVFCTAAIITGGLWAKGTWGEFWRWEDRKLFMTLVLWLVFMAYLALRSNSDPGKARARLSAVFSIIGCMCIPLSFAANRIWTQSHPTVIASESGSLQTSMVFTLITAVFAFSFLYGAILLTKMDVENMREELEEIKQEIGDLDG